MTIEEVSATDANAAIEAGAFLLDVRNDDEWQAGHAPNATYITLAEVDARRDEIPQGTPVIAVCRAGGRSLRAAEILAAHGFAVRNLTGGMQAWAASGLPVVDNTGQPGTVI